MPLAARWCRVSGWYLVGLIHYIYTTMAIIRNSANRIMRGRVGETTYYVSKGQQVARQAQNDSNYGETARRTDAQQSRRVLWSNLVQFYKISSRWMQKAFETKRLGQTDYNKFVQVNIGASRIALTKSESVAGACVVDRYVVSQGSLPSVSVVASGAQWYTNLLIGNLNIGAATTIGELTDALVANNANVRAGMQISFVSYMQSIDSIGTPRVSCRCYECTLVTGSALLVRDYLPEFCSTSVNGALGTSSSIAAGGFAYILSELVNGQLKVSTQQLIISDNTFIEQYSSAQQVEQAIQSYGINTEVILSPVDTIQQEPEPVPVYITAINYTKDNVIHVVTPNSYFGPCDTLYEIPTTVIIRGLSGRTVSTVRLLHGTSNTYQGTISEQDSMSVTATFPSIKETDASIIRGIQVELNDSTVVTVAFATTQQ